MTDGVEVKRCPFPDCDWELEYEPLNDASDIIADERSEKHYEDEHAGRVRVLVTIEVEQRLGARSPSDAREHAMERFEERGHDVAFVRSEVVEEASDHSKLENQPEPPSQEPGSDE